MSLRHEPDVSKAAWFASRDEPWTQLCCLGPSGFEQYARLFPDVPDDNDVTDPQAAASLEGDLPDGQLRRLAVVLAQHTSTPDDSFFALWDGFGDLHGGPAVSAMGRRRSMRRRSRSSGPTVLPAFPTAVMSAPRVHLPNRDYLLFAGPLTEAGAWGAADLWPGTPRRINSPNLMWPADLAWFVATEIDQPWTGIGGSAALIDDLLSTEDIEPTELSDHPPYWR